MFPFGCWIIFALTVAIFDNLEAVSVVKHHHDDEYLLEHRVIYQDAINKAHNLTLYPGKFRTFLFLPPTIKKNIILKLASTLSVKNNLLEPKLLLKFTQKLNTTFPENISNQKNIIINKNYVLKDILFLFSVDANIMKLRFMIICYLTSRIEKKLKIPFKINFILYRFFLPPWTVGNDGKGTIYK